MTGAAAAAVERTEILLAKLKAFKTGSPLPELEQVSREIRDETKNLDTEQRKTLLEEYLRACTRRGIEEVPSWINMTAFALEGRQWRAERVI